MPVLAIKTEARCKFCQSPHRAVIDAWLERRSNGESDENGERINAEYVKARFVELGVKNPTDDNIKTHWRKHCEKVTTAQVADKEQTFEEAVRRWNAGERVDVDTFLQFLLFHGYVELAQKVERGEPLGITIDQLLKATGESTKRKTSDAQARLLDGLGGAIAGAFQNGGLAPVGARPQLEPEMIDVEAEEVD